jgi:hypothetical protein
LGRLGVALPFLALRRDLQRGNAPAQREFDNRHARLALGFQRGLLRRFALVAVARHDGHLAQRHTLEDQDALR